MQSPYTPPSSTVPVDWKLQRHRGVNADSAVIAFYFFVGLAIYLWRYGSLFATTLALIVCLIAAPDRFLARKYKAFMEWPDRLILNHWRFSDLVIFTFMAPFWFLFPVKFRGLENIPKDGSKILFIANHQIWALDAALKMSAIYKATGIFIRPITDRAHGNIPLFKHLIIGAGGIPGTREATQALMDRGTPLLIYPGGALEVWKSAHDDPYGLCWKDRTGFARMAAANGYKIIPLASVGMADTVNILFTIPAKLLWGALGDKRAKKPSAKPVARESAVVGEEVRTAPPRGAPMTTEMGDGIPVVVPNFRLQANYVVIGEPIDAAEFVASAEEGVDGVTSLRDRVKAEVEAKIHEALKWREHDEERYTVDRVKSMLGMGGKVKAQ
ncbi:Transmembrane protein 68 [Irineochytrium annulatum]|nr:Transmembrane protein 68 [Irineochytrium annulatum]